MSAPRSRLTCSRAKLISGPGRRLDQRLANHAAIALSLWGGGGHLAHPDRKPGRQLFGLGFVWPPARRLAHRPIVAGPETMRRPADQVELVQQAAVRLLISPEERPVIAVHCVSGARELPISRTHLASQPFVMSAMIRFRRLEGGQRLADQALELVDAGLRALPRNELTACHFDRKRRIESSLDRRTGRERWRCGCGVPSPETPRPANSIGSETPQEPRRPAASKNAGPNLAIYRMKASPAPRQVQNTIT